MGTITEIRTKVSVRVKNTGGRGCATVVQVYSGQPSKLVAFARVPRTRDEERVVTIPVERRLLARWDERGQKWLAPSGAVTFRVGQNVGDLPLSQEVRF